MECWFDDLHTESHLRTLSINPVNQGPCLWQVAQHRRLGIQPILRTFLYPGAPSSCESDMDATLLLQVTSPSVFAQFSNLVEAVSRIDGVVVSDVQFHLERILIVVMASVIFLTAFPDGRLRGIPRE